MNHHPWDSGAIENAFVQVFGTGVLSLIAHKTVKAKCGKRVSVKLADALGPVTCQECRAELEREQAGYIKIAEFSEKQFPDNPGTLESARQIREGANYIAQVLAR